jgi:radical SAM-linked protein
MTDARQRWRVLVARGPAARDVPHRDIAAAWEEGLKGAGLPLVLTEGRHPQPRVVFAAPVPVGMLAEREPLDLWLADLRRIHEVRPAVEAAMPIGHRIVDLYDVWIGAPSLPASVVAGDYFVTIRPATASAAPGPHTTIAVAAAACDSMLAATLIARVRSKGGATVGVDIRPHILSLKAAAAVTGDGTSLELEMRLLLGGERGVGRPEEVLAELGDRLGVELVADEIVRRRVILADDA